MSLGELLNCYFNVSLIFNFWEVELLYHKQKPEELISGILLSNLFLLKIKTGAWRLILSFQTYSQHSCRQKQFLVYRRH